MTTHEIIGQEYNCETGEVTDLYADEIYYANQAAIEAERIASELAAQSKATARQEVLNRLGLTSDEVLLLLG
jgi:hypothetical protein